MSWTWIIISFFLLSISFSNAFVPFPFSVSAFTCNSKWQRRLFLLRQWKFRSFEWSRIIVKSKQKKKIAIFLLHVRNFHWQLNSLKTYIKDNLKIDRLMIRKREWRWMSPVQSFYFFFFIPSPRIRFICKKYNNIMLTLLAVAIFSTMVVVLTTTRNGTVTVTIIQQWRFILSQW